MMNATGRLLDPNIANCSPQELEARFLGLLGEIQIRYRTFGIFLGNPSSGAVAQFHSLSFEAKTEVLAQLRMVYLISDEAQLPNPDKLPRERFELPEEISAIKSFLWRAGMRFADDEFFTKMRKDDIVEIYNTDHRQIYRSWSFFAVCSYSLADILVYDWNTLYARPAWVVSRCFTDLCDLFEGRRKMVKMEIPEFLLQENFSLTRHSILMKLRFATALLDLRTGEIRGYACTTKGTLFNAPGTNDKISFI